MVRKTSPESQFLKVKCADCGNMQTIFNKSNIKISCNVCGATMAIPRGGIADIKGEIMERVDKDQIKKNEE